MCTDIMKVHLGPSGYTIPEIPTTIKKMDVNRTTIAYLRVLIIEIGSTIILMVVEAQGYYTICPLGRIPQLNHHLGSRKIVMIAMQ